VWSLNAGSNPLPAGLELNPSGVISGTPTTAGTTVLTVKVTDAASGTASKPLTLTITPVNHPLAITTASPLPEGTVGSAYSATILATGGTGTRSWTVAGGALPAGLRLDSSTGVISGAPNTASSTTITVKVTDSVGATATKDFTLVIAAAVSPLKITTTVLPPGTVGAAYNITLAATGGTGTKSWSMTGALPDGLKLDAASGIISGTSTTVGTFPFIAQVQDSGTPQQSAQQPLTIVIVASGNGGEGGGGGGRLTVSDAPASFNIGEAFTANPQSTQVIRNQNLGAFDIEWAEGNTSPNHLEQLALTGSLTEDSELGVTFLVGDRGASGLLTCLSSVHLTPLNPCQGLTVNRSAGTATFVNTVLVRSEGTLFQPITLNGTLTFTPF
jgi:hypothetical protein